MCDLVNLLLPESRARIKWIDGNCQFNTTSSVFWKNVFTKINLFTKHYENRFFINMNMKFSKKNLQKRCVLLAQIRTTQKRLIEKRLTSFYLSSGFLCLLYFLAQPTDRVVNSFSGYSVRRVDTPLHVLW